MDKNHQEMNKIPENHIHISTRSQNNSNEEKYFDELESSYMKEMDDFDFDIEDYKEKKEKLSEEQNVISQQTEREYQKMELEEGEEESLQIEIPKIYMKNRDQQQEQLYQENIIEEDGIESGQIEPTTPPQINQTIIPDYLHQLSSPSVVQNQNNVIIQYIQSKAQSRQTLKGEKLQQKNQTKEEELSSMGNKSSSCSYSLSEERKKQERDQFFKRKSEKNQPIYEENQDVKDRELEDLNNSECIQEFKGEMYQISGNMSYHQQSEVFRKYIMNMRKTLRRQYEKCRLRHENSSSNQTYTQRASHHHQNQNQNQQQQQSEQPSQIKEINQKQFMIYYKRQQQTNKMLSKQKEKLQSLLKEKSFSDNKSQSNNQNDQNNQGKLQQKDQKICQFEQNEANLLIQPDTEKNQKTQNQGQLYQKIKFSKIKQNAYNSSKFRSYLRVIMLQMSNYIDMTDKVELVFRMDYRKLMAYYMDIVGPKQMIRYETFDEDNQEYSFDKEDVLNQKNQQKNLEQHQKILKLNQINSQNFMIQQSIQNQQQNEQNEQNEQKIMQQDNQMIFTIQQNNLDYDQISVAENIVFKLNNQINLQFDDQLETIKCADRNVQIDLNGDGKMQVQITQVINNVYTNQITTDMPSTQIVSQSRQRQQETIRSCEVDNLLEHINNEVQNQNHLQENGPSTPKFPISESINIELQQQIVLESQDLNQPVHNENNEILQLQQHQKQHQNISQEIIYFQDSIDIDNENTPQFVPPVHQIMFESLQHDNQNINFSQNVENKQNVINISQDDEEEISIPKKKIMNNQENIVKVIEDSLDLQQNIPANIEEQLVTNQIERKQEDPVSQQIGQNHKKDQQPLINNVANQNTSSTRQQQQPSTSTPPKPKISASHIRLVLLETYPSLEQMINSASDEQILALYEQLANGKDDEDNQNHEENDNNNKNNNNNNSEQINNINQMNKEENQKNCNVMMIGKSVSVSNAQNINHLTQQSINQEVKDLNETNKSHQANQINLIDLQEPMIQAQKQFESLLQTHHEQSAKIVQENNIIETQNIITESQSNLIQTVSNNQPNQNRHTQNTYTSYAQPSPAQQQHQFKQNLTYEQLQLIIKTLIETNPEIEQQIKSLSKEQLLNLYKQGIKQNKQLKQKQKQKEKQKNVSDSSKFIERKKKNKTQKQVIDLLEDDDEQENSSNKSKPTDHNKSVNKQIIKENNKEINKENKERINQNITNNNNETQSINYQQEINIIDRTSFSYLQVYGQSQKQKQIKELKIKKFWKAIKTNSDKPFVRVDMERFYQFIDAHDYESKLKSTLLKNSKTRNEKAKDIALIYMRQLKKNNLKHGGFQEYTSSDKDKGSRNNNNEKAIIIPWNKQVSCIKNSIEMKDNISKDKRLTIEIPKISQERKARILQLKRQKQLSFEQRKKLQQSKQNNLIPSAQSPQLNSISFNSVNLSSSTTKQPLNLKKCFMVFYEQYLDERDQSRLEQEIVLDRTKKRVKKSYRIEKDEKKIFGMLKQIINNGIETEPETQRIEQEE